MGLLDRLFGKGGPASPEEAAAEAKALLDDAARFSSATAKDAIQALRKEGRRLYDALGMGRELGELYRRRAIEAWTREDPAVKSLAWPTVAVVPWDTWPEPMMKDLTAMAAERNEDAIYLVPPDRRNPRDALSELEGLKELAAIPDAALVVLGEEGVLARRDFLIEASRTIAPESEDIIQDLMDAAEQSGKKVRTVVV